MSARSIQKTIRVVYTSVENDNAQPVVSLDRVSTIMSSRLLRRLLADPALMLPEISHVVIIPAALLPQTPRKTMRRINISRTGVMVPKSREDRPRKESLEHLKHAGLDVLKIIPGILQLGIMRLQVSSVESPGQRLGAIALASARQRPYSLQSSEGKIVGRVTMERSIGRGGEENLVLRKLVVIVTATAHARGTVCLGVNRKARIQMEVRHMQDLDALTTGLGNLGIRRLGLGEQTQSIQRTGMGLRTEAVFQRMANVLAIQALNVGKCQHLGPDGTEGARIVGALTGLIGSEVERLAEVNHRVRNHVGSEQSRGLDRSQGTLAFGTVGLRALGLDDLRHIGLDFINEGMFLMSQQTSLGHRKIKLISSLGDDLRVRELKRERVVQNGVMNDWLRLLGRLSRGLIVRTVDPISRSEPHMGWGCRTKKLRLGTQEQRHRTRPQAARPKAPTPSPTG